MSIVGKYKAAYMIEYIGSDFESFDRVVVEQQSYIARTTAGKVELATNLLQQGIIKRPEEYLSVLETGRLDPLIEGEHAELLLIRSENESLSKGKKVVVLPTDRHAVHINEHKAVLANPEARNEGDITSVVLEHIAEHIQLYKTTDPMVLMLTGNDPLPPGMAQGPSGPPAPNGAGNSAVIQPEQPENGLMEKPPNLPNLPKAADPVSQDSYDKLQNINQQ
jgi:hypothetical protein